MERKIGGKIDAYIIDLKDAFSSKIRELGTAASAAAASATESDGSVGTIEQLCKQLTKFVYEYEKLKMTKLLQEDCKQLQLKSLIMMSQ